MIDQSSMLAKFKGRSPATPEMIAEAEESVGRKLPATYGQFLAVHDGGEGFVGENYLILWSIVELASANRDYQVEEWVPGLLLFGSNGGGEAFGFDFRHLKIQIVKIPFIVIDWKDARLMGSTFDEFLERLWTEK